MRALLTPLLLTAAALAVPPAARAFPALTLAQGAAPAPRQLGRLVVVRDGTRTVLTLAPDHRGGATALALVVPVPAGVTRSQLHIAEPGPLERLDLFTSPRFVEVFDPNPCAHPKAPPSLAPKPSSPAASEAEWGRGPRPVRGIVPPQRHDAGTYGEVQVLSAPESRNVTGWLTRQGFRVPEAAARALRQQAQAGRQFVVARLKVDQSAAAQPLRPLQVAFDSDRLELPLALGAANSQGSDELALYVITRSGRATLKGLSEERLPDGLDLPQYLRHDVGRFHQSLLARRRTKAKGPVAFLEYTGDLGWCSPCTTEPLSPAELGQLGVFWAKPPPPGPAGSAVLPELVFATRWRLVYDSRRLAAPAEVQVTTDRNEFQPRYNLREPFAGEATCDAARTYHQGLAAQREAEAVTLAQLTGWDLVAIRREMGIPPPPTKDPTWTDDLWHKKPAASSKSPSR